jgi:predicted transcriptional regulator
MKLKEFLEIIEGKLLTKENIMDIEINGGYVSDLLSDVMGNAQEGQVWITIMRHLNVVAVASLTNVPAITFSKGYMPDAAVIAKADQEGITLISSNLNTFDIAGILYKHLS